MKKVTFDDLFDEKSGVFRCIPVIGFIVTALTLIPHFHFFPGPEASPYKEIHLALKFLSLGALLILVKYPKKLGVFSVISFLISVFWSVLPGFFLYSLLNSILCFATLLARGFFKKHAKLKVFLISIFYFLLSFNQLRFGKECFINYLSSWFTTWIILFASIYYILAVFYGNMKKITETPFVLDECPFLEESDIYIICRIVQNEKYDSIARTFKVSERTIKRRCARIFEHFQCADKLDFFSKYSNHPIVYKGEEYMTSDRSETEAYKNLEKKIKGI